MRGSIRQRINGIECPMLKWMLNYDIEAGFTSLLTPPEGRFSTPKGDIRIQTRSLTRLAEKPGNTMMGGAIKIGLVEIFCDFWLQFPAAYPASIRWQRSYSYPTST